MRPTGWRKGETSDPSDFHGYDATRGIGDRPAPMTAGKAAGPALTDHSSPSSAATVAPLGGAWNIAVSGAW